MLAFGRFLREQAAGGGEAEEHAYDAMVEQLVQRVSEAVLLPDRREALQSLRDLLAGSGGAKAQLAFGSVGIPAMLQVVRDQEDLEMVQLALESLAAAVGGVNARSAGSQAAAINAQQLARTPDALALLLSLLELGPAGVGDFYARYHALQVVKGLAAAAPHPLQQAILAAPLGMTRLMDLLGEQEVLRNEALLLLTALAAGSADLQKIAAFEGAFDRLFAIIKEEGGLEGDIVVQDCLQLLAALLRGSPQNQLMFRETGFLAQLPTRLRPPADGGGGGGEGLPAELAPQRAANLAAALEVVLALLPPPGADPAAPVCASHAENRQALLQRGMLNVLVALGLQGGGLPDGTVRAQALLCLAALVGGSRLQQDQLAAVSVRGPGGEAQPLLQAVLHAAVCADSAAEQAAAGRLLEAYCLGNSAGQAVLAASLLHAGGAAAGTFGGFLLSSLARQGGLAELAASSRAAAALSHLVSGNPGMQPHLLALQVPAQRPASSASNDSATGSGGGGSTPLMALCAAHLGALTMQPLGRQPGALAAAANTLRLLLAWLHACPPAVTAFLRAVAQSKPFLVDSIRGSNACSGCAASGHPLARGQLALLLGLCASYAEEGGGTPTQQQLLGAIEAQIGRQQFLGVLDGLVQHPAVSGTAGGTGGAGISALALEEGVDVSPAFAAFLQTLAAEVRHRVTGGQGPPPLPPPPAAAPAARPQQQAVPAPAAFHAPPPPSFHAAPPPPSAAAGGGSSGPAPWASPHAPRPSSPLAAQPPWPVSAAYQAVPPPTANGTAPPAAAAAAPAAAAPPFGAPKPPPAASPAALSPRSRVQPQPPGPPPSGQPAGAAAGEAAAQLQQARSVVEALQRENQQLHAELAALSARLASGDAAAAAAAEAQQRVAEAERAAELARADAAAAQAAARKLEGDLEDLSAAYSNLDAHTGSLQQRVDGLQQELAAARQAAAAAQAQAAAQQQQAAGGGGGVARAGGLGEAGIEQRVAAARAEAQAEADEALTDLLVCLGQEEAKVARLREALAAYGVDCDAMLADIVAAGEAGGGAEEEDMT